MPFSQKNNIPLKSLYLVIMSNLTTQEYKGKIYVKNIRKNHVGSETGSGSGSETLTEQ